MTTICVEVTDISRGLADHPISALYAGERPGGKPHLSISQFADIHCPSDEFIEFYSIHYAQRAIDYLKSKGYKARILTGGV